MSHEFAWAAGFFDGEGSFSVTRRRDGKTPKGICVSINQVDLEPLERFRTAVRGLGKITGPYPPNSPLSKRDRFMYRAQNLQSAQAVLCFLWRWLSTPKREQALRAFREVRLYDPLRG